MNFGMFLYLAVGIGAGIFAGFFGVGGGIVLVPALVFLFGLQQHQAQGLSLAALVLPTGLLGALAYYKAHPFPIKPAFFIALGLFAGAYIGGTLAQEISGRSLRVAFGVLTIAAGIKLILSK